jgi:acyl carrier protein
MNSTPTHAQVARWLSSRVATYLDVPAAAIDPAMPLAELGLDSVSAVGLCGDIEQRWRIQADPILVYDYPTIAEIAGHVAARLVVEDAGKR